MSGEFEISVEELKTRLDRGEIGFILDLRLENEFADWRIEARGPVEIVNIPQLDFVGDEENTVHGRLKSLGDEIVVLPSHAASLREMDDAGVVRLTLGEARRTLPHFSLTGRVDFVAHVKATLLENPERYQVIRQVNLGLLDPEEACRQELEIGKNLCGMAEKKG